MADPVPPWPAARFSEAAQQERSPPAPFAIIRTQVVPGPQPRLPILINHPPEPQRRLDQPQLGQLAARLLPVPSREPQRLGCAVQHRLLPHPPRVKPNLAKVGAKVEFSQSHHPRTITLEWVGETASRASHTSHQADDQAKRGDAPGTQWDAGDARGGAGGNHASHPETGSDQPEQQRWDAWDAGDAPEATRSSGDAPPRSGIVFECDRCGHHTAPAITNMTGFPHPCPDGERGQFRPVPPEQEQEDT